MAWNQPGEDKKRPPRGGPDDSSLDDVLRRWQRRVQRLWRPGSGRGTAALILVGVALFIWLGTGVYLIDSNERGVVQRFGQFISIQRSGYGWRWPWPIETVRKFNVEAIKSSDSKARVLTADQSLVDVGFSVQYRINDPVLFAFQVREPDATLKETSETVMRELVAHFDLSALLNGEARGRMTTDALQRIQKALEVYRTGVVVTSVNVTELQLPDQVLNSQRDAEKADEDRRREIADAQAYANDIVPKASAAAEHQMADAEVYAAQTLSTAQGEAERFTQLANAYTQAPEITRNRMYTETMESILSRSHKIIVDAKSSSGNLIYLPLDKLAEAVKQANQAQASNTPSTPAASNTNGTAANAAPATAGSDRADGDERGRERTDR